MDEIRYTAEDRRDAFNIVGSSGSAENSVGTQNPSGISYAAGGAEDYDPDPYYDVQVRHEERQSQPGYRNDAAEPQSFSRGADQYESAPEPGYRTHPQNSYEQPERVTATFSIRNENARDAAADLTGTDALIRQIDEFREKAAEIQQLIGAREQRMKELDREVRAKESKSVELEETLNQKRSQSDDIMRGMNGQMDRIMERMQSSNVQMTNDMQRGMSELSSGVRSDLTAMSSEMRTSMSSMQDDMKLSMNSLSDDMRSNMNTLSGDMRTNIAEIKDTVQTQLVDQNAEMKNTIDDLASGLATGLEGVKADISEKVHSENVKVYRNLQDLLHDMDNSEEQKELIETQIGKIKSQNFILTVLSAVNFGMLIVLVLLSMGIL